MVQDSEKRFHQIMDKLLSAAPKSMPSSSSSSSHGEQQCRGKKRPNPSSALALVDPKTGADLVDKFHHSSAPVGALRAPLCRPWDRGDLMKRLATYKSMTWFAKPQVISAVNCARKGWVNVDMDTIACESCGSRLLFSTPSSWPQQQVEKAALVFSLKLDNGHKSLCPWIDNSCDEKLVDFPPLTPQDLVDRFRERSRALLQLLALPVISPSAIEHMKSPELEEFFKQPVLPEYNYTTAEFSLSESCGNGYERSSAKLYYQAQKLISLCGWEPRTLPYVVNCKENLGNLVRNTDIINLSQEVANGRHLSNSAHSADVNEVSDANTNSGACGEVKSDPKSVVLDCKLCGASAGLWVFSTFSRPLELCRVIGYTDVNTQKNSGGQNSGSATHHANEPEQNSNLSLTIAGGPPATKQNFRATISLPVIGRNLRVRFISGSRDNQKHSEWNKIVSGGELVLQSENMNTLETGKDDSFGDQQRKSDETADTLIKVSEAHISPGKADDNEQSSVSGRNDLHVQENTKPHSNDQEITKDRFKGPVNNKLKGSTEGKDMNQSSSSKEMEFDPIRQHRYFCPWIASTGRREPGWRQTLSALQRQRDSSQLSPLSTSLIKVDDPITSVRNLFKSPSAKKSKTQ